MELLQVDLDVVFVTSSSDLQVPAGLPVAGTRGSVQESMGPAFLLHGQSI